MNTLSEHSFLSWAETRGIGLDTRYAPPQCLTYTIPGEHSRFWAFPAQVHDLPFFVAHLLDGLAAWSHCYLWPRGGHWPCPDACDPWPTRVQATILNSVGIPAGHAGAVRVDADELEKLVTAIFAQLMFGWCVTDDLFIIPDHGRQMIQTDHHHAVHVMCLSEARMTQFIEHMAEEGFVLPDAPPDDTFKKPDWMQ